VLEIKNISKIYGSRENQVIALENVSLTLDKGDYVAIMGPSGSGKSTFLNVIGGLDDLTSGEVILEGERIDNMDEDELVRLRRGKISYVFQQYHLLTSLTALENVLLPLTFCDLAGKRSKAKELLEGVGLGKRIHHKPTELSGGEQQRVAIARALVNDPLLTLADEPTGNMDQKNGQQILDLFDLLNKQGQTIIMVTHNPEAARRAKKIVVLKDGRITDQIHNQERII
jgi:putative ABC transport system ATP-binding protein